MKYALIDGEIHIHQREADAWWPLSIEEAQHVVDVMNAYEIGTPAADSGAAKYVEKLRATMIERDEKAKRYSEGAFGSDDDAIPDTMAAELGKLFS